MLSQHADEVASGGRFAFGENWARFLQELNDDRIALAKQSLCEMLGAESLQGLRFLDIGSGSGLFSLVARKLGATVHSFDYDPQSVSCTAELKRRYAAGDSGWTVGQASVLDESYIQSLGQWDIVYSWGVLHHTGEMNRALANAARLVAPGGKLFIAIYNDQGWASKAWLIVKKAYNGLPPGLRWLVLWPAAARLWGPTTIRDLFGGTPFRTWREYSKYSLRGMSAIHDVVDWVGGLPFEVAKPDQIVAFYRERGFSLLRLRTCGRGHGCNEFVFQKT